MRPLKAIAVAGLLSAAFFAALPWLGCGWNPIRGGFEPELMRLCTFGFPGPFAPREPGIPGFNGPYWGNLLVGIAYLVAAGYVVMSRRFRRAYH